MTIKYPLDRRESILIEFALRFLDDRLGLEGSSIDDVLTDHEQMSLYTGELESLADAFKEDRDD